MGIVGIGGIANINLGPVFFENIFLQAVVRSPSSVLCGPIEESGIPAVVVFFGQWDFAVWLGTAVGLLILVVEETFGAICDLVGHFEGPAVAVIDEAIGALRVDPPRFVEEVVTENVQSKI